MIIRQNVLKMELIRGNFGIKYKELFMRKRKAFLQNPLN
jgi:hypothetical protein